MLENIGKRAKECSRILAGADSVKKDTALRLMAKALLDKTPEILAANAQDIKNGTAAGLSESLLDRLRLTAERISAISDAILKIADADNPVGKLLWGETRPNGLEIRKVTVPLGVIAVIYEARPNVTADAASLCLKAGNVSILKGGKEAVKSNIAIADAMRGALECAGLPADCIILIEDNSREVTAELMKLNEYVDVLIPRGGAGLIRAVVENSSIPVIETGIGNCHTYIDKSANLEMAAEIVYNAKTSRPSVCNACESLLIHKDVAELALLAVNEKLSQKNVEIRGDECVCAVLPSAVPATEDDWGREYGDYIISARIVDSLDEAVDHINRYGTGHSECIVTDDYAASRSFLARVDAAAVYVNASTRFTDGGEFGFGAEIGISTQKLHARGPLGLANLVSEKYLICGNGQVR